ncbi:MAG: hypothetical protein AAF141_05965 [Pseudomonadota bacterium]
MTAPTAKIDRATYFDALRNDPFNGSLSQAQVDGMNALLDVWEEHYANREGFVALELDYNMGTAFHETAFTMQPIHERGDPSYFLRYDVMGNAQKAAELGNTAPGDGFKFRGAGHVQNTGRRNARFSSDRLNEEFGLKIDFEANPDLRLDPILSAHCLFLGNHEGWWTGVELRAAIQTESWKDDRRVVNGTDKWQAIGNYAQAFRAARIAAQQEAAISQMEAELLETEVQQGAEAVTVRPADTMLSKVARFTSDMRAMGFRVSVTITAVEQPSITNNVTIKKPEAAASPT